MANFTGLAAARDAVLRQAGWDVAQRGLGGGPRVRVLVGAERHDTVDLALRYLGLGAPEPVAADDQGRIDADGLPGRAGRAATAARRWSRCRPATCTPAPSTRSPRRIAARARARRLGARRRRLRAVGGRLAVVPAPGRAAHEAADSWATDAHKTLNVPYDCGLGDRPRPGGPARGDGRARRYLILDDARRARRQGAGAVAPRPGLPGLGGAARARPLRGRGPGRRAVPARRRVRRPGWRASRVPTVLNDVVFTQVCVAFGDDARTEEVVARLLADGTAWMTRLDAGAAGRCCGSRSATGRPPTHDVERSLDAVRRAVDGL